MRVDQNAKAQADVAGVVDALRGLIWITDAAGQSTFFNRSWREYTSNGSSEALDQAWQEVVHPDDLGAVLDAWSLIKQSGVAKEIDARLRRFDGEYRWFLLHVSPFKEDISSNERWCWLGVYADENTTTDGRMRRFFDMLPWQAGFLSATGVSEFSNVQALNDFKMTHEQLELWRTSGIIHKDDHDNVQKSVLALLKTGELFDLHLRMLYPNGTYRWTRARCVPIRDAGGNVVRHVSFQIDVDELKRAETLLAAEVSLLEMVARREPLARVLTALSRHVEALCNESHCRVLTVDSDGKHFVVGAASNKSDALNELLEGKPIDGGYDPCSLALLHSTSIVVADVLADPRWKGSQWPSLLKSRGYSSCASLPIMSGASEACGVIALYRPQAICVSPSEQELLDRFGKIAGIAIDRARADDALQARERELREVLTQLFEGQRLSKTGSFTWDVVADRHTWSDEVRRLFGFDAHDPVTLPMIQSAVHPDDMATFAHVLQDAVQGGDFDFAFRILTTTGEVRHVHAVGHRAGKVTDRLVFIGALQDVTDHVIAEEGLNRARAELTHVSRAATLSTMTASIAHEVSQPLAGIMTNASTMVRMLAADPPNLIGAGETARRTIRDANRASEVIKRLRTMFSKKASTREAVNLNDAAREVVALSAGELRRGDVTLDVHYAEGLPVVSGDRVQLQQVILNLLLNAVDAMSGVDDRTRTLRIETESCDDESVKVLVRDSGTGIDQNTVEKLFDAFYTTKEHGMGVGLAISRSIIKSHNGKLWALPNDGPGATFGFSIPRSGGEVPTGESDP